MGRTLATTTPRLSFRPVVESLRLQLRPLFVSLRWSRRSGGRAAQWSYRCRVAELVVPLRLPCHSTPATKSARTPASMKHGDDHNIFTKLSEVDAIWKGLHDDSPKAKHLWELLWPVRKSTEHSVKTLKEPISQAWNSPFVPIICSPNLGLRLRPENNPSCQWRPRMSRRTSSQVLPVPGAETCSANRCSSSACSSELKSSVESSAASSSHNSWSRRSRSLTDNRLKPFLNSTMSIACLPMLRTSYRTVPCQPTTNAPTHLRP